MSEPRFDGQVTRATRCGFLKRAGQVGLTCTLAAGAGKLHAVPEDRPGGTPGTVGRRVRGKTGQKVSENRQVDCCICGLHMVQRVRENSITSWTRLTAEARKRLEKVAAAAPPFEYGWLGPGWTANAFCYVLNASISKCC